MYVFGMIPAATLETLRRKYTMLFPELNERSRRLWAASEAEVLGHGGIAAVAQVTGLGTNTIRRGLRDIHRPSSTSGRVRRRGGGRKPLSDAMPALLGALEPV
jgi:hypothetical protein